MVRKYGLTCDNLLSVELVTADGLVVHASESQNSELFWALRGGGGNFGVVTKFELALHPVGPVVLGGPHLLPRRTGDKVIDGWRDLLEDMPDELSTTFALTAAPPAPFIPEDWHYKKVAAVIGCWAGDPAEVKTSSDRSAHSARRSQTCSARFPTSICSSSSTPLWEAGAANYFTSAFLDRLPDEAIKTLGGHHRRSADLPVQAELHIHHLGGACAGPGR